MIPESSDVTALYERHEVLEFLATDGAKLGDYIARELAASEGGLTVLQGGAS